MATKPETGASARLTAEDIAIWSRFNDEPGTYGGTMRRMSRALDQSDASAMLHYTTNGELGSLPSSKEIEEREVEDGCSCYGFVSCPYPTCEKRECKLRF